MNRHFTRITALTLTAAAALTLSACGGDDDSGKREDKTAAADTGSSSSSASSTASASADPGRPQIELPPDLSYTFDWPRTRDKDKNAVLADGEQSIKAVDLAIVNQDPLDKAYLFYYEGEAAAGTEEFIKAYVNENARVTGAYRFYDAVVNIRSKSAASLVYCEDQGKAYDMYLKPRKVNKTPVTRNSYVLYNTQLRKNDKGVWVVQEIHSQRGSDSCQP
ncbi:hypothetical protein EV562_10585 [Streptomyces sp. BK208]|uniref:hypothetical protein n=1 Tax=Streptomyces sp. BK208 TaxID=2512150 RepID=UPI00105B3A73|nr:hypothetical protein [Streptomyces sp. BK208]TDT38071.1 hypothetical protein EV562_10585 [Streptomyces sp. BK208]